MIYYKNASPRIRGLLTTSKGWMCCNGCSHTSPGKSRVRRRDDTSASDLSLFPAMFPDTLTGRYPYVATEVLCSEIWSIVETCMTEQKQLLLPFFETVLDRSPDDMKTQMVMASHFGKINAVFLGKKPAEVNGPFYTNMLREYRAFACI
jgi:hypothetical protein